ncbi:hypothetical protein J3E69DRAFT_330909 [Trichoderma sp. SZMC 28015]
MCVRPLLLSYPLSVRCLNTGTGTQTTKILVSHCPTPLSRVSFSSCFFYAIKAFTFPTYQARSQKTFKEEPPVSTKFRVKNRAFELCL